MQPFWRDRTRQKLGMPKLIEGQDSRRWSITAEHATLGSTNVLQRGKLRS
jgi:hypothetical protein